MKPLALIRRFGIQATFIAMLCACGGGSKQDPEIKPGGKVEDNGQWTEIGPTETVNSNHMSVTVSSIEIDALAFNDGSRTREEHTIISIVIRNNHKDKIETYKGWNVTAYDGSAGPTLVDDVGNDYRRIAIENPNKVTGPHNGSIDIYPGKMVIDTIVFQKPVPSAKVLYLSLPSHNIGQSDQFSRFKWTISGKKSLNVVHSITEEKKKHVCREWEEANQEAFNAAAKQQPGLKDLWDMRVRKVVSEILANRGVEIKKRHGLDEKQFYLITDEGERRGWWKEPKSAVIAKPPPKIETPEEKAKREAAELEIKQDAERIFAEMKQAQDEVDAQKLYDKVTARVHLLEIIEKYPGTRAAIKAKERLDKLDKK